MISVNHVTKLYRNGKGIKDLTFDINEGEVFGFLGPNGSGKTTTIRNLMGFLEPDLGHCTINGLDCWKDANVIQKQIGYIPEEMAFLEGFKGMDFLTLIANMRKTKNRQRMNDLIELFRLDPSGKIRKMSKGMKQKLGIIAACMHDPAIMIFDEPTSGLDPLMQNVFIDFINKEKLRGKTILMSSHRFEEIDRTSDRAGIIREGILVDVQDIQKLNEKQRRAYVVTVSSEKDAEFLKKANFELGTVDKLRIEVIVYGNVNQFIKVLSRITVTSLEMNYMTLEQVFMQYYGEGTQ